MMRLLLLAGLFVLAALPAWSAIKLDPGPIPELRPPREELPPQMENKGNDLLPWFIAVGIAAVVAAVLASRPKKQALPPTPPYTIARQQLQQLNGRSATMVAVSAILRAYLLDAFQIPARGATSSELIGWLTDHPCWDTQLSPEIEAIFDTADVMKFATIPAEEHPAIIEQASALISKIEGRRNSRRLQATS